MRRFVNLPPDARSRRCDRHDYRGGAYFITTNTKKRAPLFGTVERGRMHLNRYGRIVAEEWKRTGELRDEVSLDTFIVMPDHVHGLLWICHSPTESESEENPGKGGREARLATSSKLPPGLEKPEPGTLSTIVGAFKSAVTRRINEKRDAPGETIWQASFHDRIVRNRRYIRANPQEWSRSD
ncbi:MAG: transposase [Salinibacter sp.]|uniref:transposase n=1 Tax=Salinibacter sp. TaxID=2065818 RepID=UPI0035D50B68